MKKDVVFVFLVMLAMSFTFAGECNDGVDNDGDGTIDALVNLDPQNGETEFFGSGNNPDWVSDHVWSVIQLKGLSYSDPSLFPLLGYTGGAGGGNNWDTNSGTPHSTLDIVCNILGYNRSSWDTCHDSEGKCNYNSPEDNSLTSWDGSDFEEIPAFPKYYNRWISSITCVDRFSACNDGIDNDNDGFTDLADMKCDSMFDDSEAFTHDVDCADPADLSESGITECNDGIDNDGDSFIDFPSDTGCTSAFDTSEQEASMVCDDGLDNDGDTFIDMLDPGCESIVDTSEYSNLECDDGLDNDADTFIDFLSDPECESLIDNSESVQNFWAYIDGTYIPSGTVVDFGDLVRLVSPDDPPYKVFSGATEYGKLDTKIWKTDVVDIDLAFSSNDDAYISSNMINVDPDSDDDPLNITIIRPSCADAFNINEDITFEILVEDSDDIVYGEVRFGGEIIKEFTNLDGKLVLFNHTATSPGSYLIQVIANTTRPEYYSKSSNIIIYDSFNTSEQTYVAACIGKPENFQTFASPSVEFDASDSKALIYTGSGIPSSGILPSGVFNWIAPDNLLFSWTFLYSNGQEAYCQGIGSEPCPGDLTPGATKYNFVKVFPTVDDNYAFLTVSF